MLSADYVLESVANIDRFNTTYDAFKFLKTFTETLGFERFCVLSVQGDDDDLSALSFVNNWDPELLQIYDENNLSSGSPIITHCQRSVRPLAFQLDKLPQDRDAKKTNLCVELFSDFDMTCGLSLPVHNALGLKGSVSLAGRRNELTAEDQISAHILAAYLFDVVASNGETREHTGIQLTDRERDCLTWTAAGKTSSEIADILELSDHTVNHYLGCAARKLDAVNRTQAVAKAIRMDLLS